MSSHVVNNIPPRAIWTGREYFDAPLVGAFDTYYSAVMPVRLNALLLGTREVGVGTALSLMFPPVASVNEVTAYIDDLLIRPEPTLGTPACWENGGFFEHCWNLRLNRPSIHGDNARISPGPTIFGTADPAQPFSFHTALRFKGCQDVHCVGANIYGGVEVGIALDAGAAGHGEGLLLHTFNIVHARVGVRVVSSLPGDLPTPWMVIAHFHVYHHATGLLIVNRSEPTIHDGDIYCSPETESGTGIYIVKGRAHKIHHNTIWNLSRNGGYCMVLDDVDGAIIDGNTLYSNYVGIWLTRTTRNCKVYGNNIQAPWPIVDHGINNDIRQ
jgi:parallel beta-helix repeat protein